MVYSDQCNIFLAIFSIEKNISVVTVQNVCSKSELSAVNTDSCKTPVTTENYRPKLLKNKNKKNQWSIFMKRNNFRLKLLYPAVLKF